MSTTEFSHFGDFGFGE